jgi:hypothetical protein
MSNIPHEPEFQQAYHGKIASRHHTTLPYTS